MNSAPSCVTHEEGCAHPRRHTGIDAGLVLRHELDINQVRGVQGDPRLRQQDKFLVQRILQAGSHQRPRGLHKGKGPPFDMHPLADLFAMKQAVLCKACIGNAMTPSLGSSGGLLLKAASFCTEIDLVP